MNGKPLLVRALVTAIGIATLVSSLAVLLSRWDTIVGAAARLRLGWLVAGIAALGLCYAVFAGLWWAAVRVLGAGIRPGAALHAFALAQLPKYVPGRVVGHGVRVSAAKAAGVPVPVALASLVLEGALGLVGALAIAAGGLLLGIRVTDNRATQWLVTLFVAVLTAAASALLIRWPGGRWRERLGLPGLEGRRVGLVALAGGYAASWLVLGAAYWLLANAVAAVPVSIFLPLTVAVAVATGIGQLAVVAPAGIGVREGALYVFARAWMNDPQALLFVSLGRAAAIAIEVLLTAAATAKSLGGSSRHATQGEA